MLKFIEKNIFPICCVIMILAGLGGLTKKHPCRTVTARRGCETHEEYDKRMNKINERIKKMSDAEKLQILLENKERLSAQKRSIKTFIELYWLNGYISELKEDINTNQDLLTK